MSDCLNTATTVAYDTVFHSHKQTSLFQLERDHIQCLSIFVWDVETRCFVKESLCSRSSCVLAPPNLVLPFVVTIRTCVLH